MLTKIIAAMQRNNYIINNKKWQLNIVGLRSTAQNSNKFNDVIVVFYKDANNQWVMQCYRATTHPGRYWLQHPMQKAGTAILKPGQYSNAYAVGLHRGKYEALVQQKPVTVYRDANLDDICNQNENNTQSGLFGINIHRASAQGTTMQVDKYSAGCQVFSNADDFRYFMQAANQHKQLYGNAFTYTLLLDTL